MQKDSDHPIEISSDLARVEPEIPRSLPPPKAGIIRNLGARADGIVVIDYGNDRIIHYDRRLAPDDVHLGHSALASHLRDY